MVRRVTPRAGLRLLPALFALGFVVPAPSVARERSWIEVTSPNFTVISDASENRAREVAREFEEIRQVFRTALSNVSSDPPMPIVIFAVRDEDGLEELLPRYWEREGPKPHGVFHRTPDKYVIALRTDARGRDRFQVIYHEYFHVLTSLNSWRLPVWLAEGLAEFWERVVIRSKQVEMGNPNWAHVEFLKNRAMAPLETFLAMRTNPHESDPNRVTVFYAQSWALTHWMMLGDETGERRRRLSEYMTRTTRGDDPVESFHSLFGGVEDVEQELRRYLRSRTLRALRMELAAEVDEDTFSARPLSELETKAVKGNFFVMTRQPELGLPLLEEVLGERPDHALALESFGLHHVISGEADGATTWLVRAAEAGSTSFLAQYYRAVLAEGESEEEKKARETALERSIELNPRFAPAYSALSDFYDRHTGRMERAFSLAKKTTELEPENSLYWVKLGDIVLRVGRPDQASKAVERAKSVARTEFDSKAIARLSQAIDRHEERKRRLTEPSQSQSPSQSTTANAAQTAPDEATLLSMLESTRKNGRYQTVRGVLREFRCLGDEGFHFVIDADERSFVFAVPGAQSLRIVEDGEVVRRDLYCGGQRESQAVVAKYLPPEGPDAEQNKDVDGRLIELEFVTPQP